MNNPVSRVITITTVIDGSDGYSSAIVRLYRRSASVLTDSDRPSGTLYYKFATGKLYTDAACTTEATSSTPAMNGWSMTKPQEDADTKLYVTMATATSREATDDIIVNGTATPPVNEWSSPVEYSEGMHSATVMLYKRSATPLTAHGITAAVYYRFSDGKLFSDKAATTETAIGTNKLNGWTRTVPETDGNPLYQIQATAVSIDAMDNIGSGEWSTPVKYVKDGTDGQDMRENLIDNSQGPKTFEVSSVEADAYGLRRYEPDMVFDTAKVPDDTPLSGRMRITFTGCSFGDNAHAFLYFSTPGSYPQMARINNPANGMFEVKKENFTIESGHGTYDGMVHLCLANFNSIGTVTIERVKLEVADKCSGWCLSENDKKAKVLDIDNEYDKVETDSKGKITAARTIETIVRLWLGSDEVDISAATVSISGGPASSIAPLTQSAEGSGGKGRKLSWAFIAGQTMASVYNVLISYIYLGVTYKATFTIGASMGQAIFQLKPTMSSIPFPRNAAGEIIDASKNVGLSIVKLDGGSVTEYASASAAGVTVRYDFTTMPANKDAGTAWTYGNIMVANDKTNLFIAMFNAAGTLLDRETVPVVKDGVRGANGENVIQLTLDNQHEDFLYSDSGRVSPTGGATSPIHLYDGQTDKTADVVIQVYDDNTKTWVTSTGASASAAAAIMQSGGTATLSVTDLRADSVKVRVRAKYPNDSTGKYYYAEFTANKTSQDKYDMVVGPSSIAYNPASYTSQTQKRIKVYANVTNLKNVTTQATISTSSGSGTLRLMATYDGSTVQITNTVTDGGKTKHYLDVTPEIAAANDGIYLELRKYSGTSYTVVDYETVEIAKAINGAAGTQYQRIYKSTNSATEDKPTGSAFPPSEWSTTPTAVSSSTRYRHMSERYSNDGGATWTAWSTPVVDTYLAEDGRSIKINGQFTKAQVTAYTGAAEPTSADIINYLNHTYPNAANYDGYLYTENGHLWIFNGTTWEDVGQIKGDKGDDGIGIEISPANVILEQDSEDGTFSISAQNPYPISIVAKAGDGNTNLVSSITNANSHCIASQGTSIVALNVDNTNKRINVIGVDSTAITNGYVEGIITATVNITGYDSVDIKIPVYLNLKQKFRREVFGDTEQALASAHVYSVDSQGQIVDREYLYKQVNNAQESITTISRHSAKRNLFARGKWKLNDSGYSDASYDAQNDRWYDEDANVNDIYSPIVRLTKGTYCFYGYVPLERTFETSGNTITMLYSNSSGNVYNGDVITASDVGVVANDIVTINNRTYHRCYAVFVLTADNYCAINIWGNADESDIAVPCLSEGSIPDIDTSTSQIKQTAENIEFKVKNDYASAGISISVDGNVSKIVLDASKIQINNGTTTAAMFENGKIKADYIDAKVIKAGSVSGNEFTFASGTVLKDLTVRGTVYAENGEFTGKITATSGSITGDLVLGDEQKAHFKLQPSVSYGTNKAAKIAGYDTSGTEVISLQFYDSENHLDPQLRLGESWFGEKRGQIRCQANGNLSTIDYLVAEGNAHAEFYEDYKLNGVQFVNKIRIGVDNGDVTLRATNYEESKSAWPLSNQNAIQNAQFGKVYGVTLSSLQTMLINRDSYGSQVVVFVARNDTK